MKRLHLFPFLIILTAILLLMSLPKVFSEKSRSLFVSLFTPLWEPAANVKSSLSQFIDPNTLINQEIQRLNTENLALSRELKNLQGIVQHELYLTRSGVNRSTEWQKLMDLYVEAIPAKVIFRDFSSWGSSFWINRGEEDNQKTGKALIAKNSPVVIGYSLVGVIDYVGKKQSRVRLLTDSGLTPAVRAARGEPNLRMLREQLNLIMDNLMNQDQLFSGPDQKMDLIAHLEGLESKITKENSSSLYLAKGFLKGYSRPVWRSQGQLLKGTGFNCDFSDAISVSRDLRTGAPTDSLHDKSTFISILQEKDLLITTGMDGVFPPGLHVAQVTKVYPLKEGDYYYELEARPIAGPLEELSLVYVIPPLGFDPEDQPPLMGWE